MSRHCVLLTAILFGGALVLLTPAEAVAQGGLGLKAGVNFSTLRGDLIDAVIDGSDVEVLQFKTGTGFVAGGFYAIPVGGALYIQPEVLYQRRVSKFDFNELAEVLGAGAGLSASVRAEYLQIPVLLKWQPGIEGVRATLFAGPALAFRLSAEARAEFMGMTETEDLKDQTASTDFGLVFGAGVAFGSFGLEARYDLGLSNVNSEEDDPTSLKWGTISLLAGFTF